MISSFIFLIFLDILQIGQTSRVRRMTVAEFPPPPTDVDFMPTDDIQSAYLIYGSPLVYLRGPVVPVQLQPYYPSFNDPNINLPNPTLAVNLPLLPSNTASDSLVPPPPSTNQIAPLVTNSNPQIGSEIKPEQDQRLAVPSQEIPSGSGSGLAVPRFMPTDIQMRNPSLGQNFPGSTQQRPSSGGGPILNASPALPNLQGSLILQKPRDFPAFLME